MAIEADKESGDSKMINAAIRSAKKASRPTKIGLPEPARPKPKSAPKKSKSSFDQELGGHAAKKPSKFGPNSLKGKNRSRKRKP